MMAASALHFDFRATRFTSSLFYTVFMPFLWASGTYLLSVSWTIIHYTPFFRFVRFFFFSLFKRSLPTHRIWCRCFQPHSHLPTSPTSASESETHPPHLIRGPEDESVLCAAMEGFGFLFSCFCFH